MDANKQMGSPSSSSFTSDLFSSKESSASSSFGIFGSIFEPSSKTKKVTARNDKEATEADLQTAKMQVEATDAAEDIKKRLHDKSN